MGLVKPIEDKNGCREEELLLLLMIGRKFLGYKYEEGSKAQIARTGKEEKNVNIQVGREKRKLRGDCESEVVKKIRIE